MSELRDILDHVRLADAFDVLFVSVILYVLITWLRRALSWRQLGVVILGAGIYATAHAFELFMVETLVRALLVVFLVVLVVAFQADIRHAIQQVSTVRWRGRGAQESAQGVLAALASSAEHLAGQGIGALVILSGSQPVTPYVDGGVSLGGQVSETLLRNIFHPKAPGHDGAVILEGEKIERFAARLPLSSNEGQIRSRGTRHAAAIGLTERCDALALVVSEENGQISVAEHGELQSVDAEALPARLATFWRAHHGAPDRRRIRWWPGHSVQNAVLAVLLAACAWYVFARPTDIVSRTFTVPVEFRNLKADWRLEDPVPSKVDVTLTGPAQGFALLDARDLVVSLDLAGLESGRNELRIEEDSIELPRSLSLHQVEPERLLLLARAMVRVEVPVEAVVTGTPPAGVTLGNPKVSPERITLLVREDGAAPSRILTEPIDASALKEPWSVSAKLSVPVGARIPAGAPGAVTVKFEVRSER